MSNPIKEELCEKLDRALQEQARVLVRYRDRSGAGAVTSGVVLEIDGDFAVIGPSPTAPPRRVPLDRIDSVETLDQPGGAS